MGLQTRLTFWQEIRNFAGYFAQRSTPKWRFSRDISSDQTAEVSFLTWCLTLEMRAFTPYKLQHMAQADFTFYASGEQCVLIKHWGHFWLLKIHGEKNGRKVNFWTNPSSVLAAVLPSVNLFQGKLWRQWIQFAISNFGFCIFQVPTCTFFPSKHYSKFPSL